MRSPAPTPVRIESIDMLRGIAILLMTLDHTRVFFHSAVDADMDPLHAASGSIPLFLTRWVAHFCMPVFVFLAGTGAFLSGSAGTPKRERSLFLLTRGFWLILVGLTWIHWVGGSFAIHPHHQTGVALWAIGWSMIVLAALLHFPHSVIATLAILLIVGHNTLDAITAEPSGSFAWVWRILHEGGTVRIVPGLKVLATYPLIPWIGVMAAGYAFGGIMLKEPPARAHWLRRVGLNLVVVFFLLRFANLYGDPRPWTSQPSGFRTILSMLDCTEYPPSLCYLLMTLGPTALLLAWLDRANTDFFNPLRVLGRVPLFYCLLHLPLIHCLAVGVNLIRFDRADWLNGNPDARPPPEAGFDLPVVYLASAIVIVLLFPACQWFADLKRRKNHLWLRYL